MFIGIMINYINNWNLCRRIDSFRPCSAKLVVVSALAVTVVRNRDFVDLDESNEMFLNCRLFRN